MIRSGVPIWLESAAAIVLALVLSTVCTVIIFQIEDESETARTYVEMLYERVATTSSAVEKAPVSLRPELLHAFSRITRYVTLDDGPLIATDAKRDAKAETRIRSIMGPASRREVRVHPLSADEARSVDMGPPSDSLPPAGTMVGPPTLLISIDVANGGWLNVRYRAPEPKARYGAALASGLVAVGVMILATLWTRRRFAMPLQRLAAAAVALKRGEPVPVIPETGPGAMQAAARSFNAMSQRLTATLENQRAIMTAVAHDLRTPIASMRLRAEFVGNEEEQARLLQTLDEMQTMTEAVLSAARADRTGEAARPVDLTALAESLAEDMTEMGGDVSFEPGGVVRCMCRTNEVKRALRNLVENALRYGKRARVRVSVDKQNAVVRVDDDGPGIPATELDRVFEPFARLEASRSSRTGGYGLGLSIARWIARGHGGDIVLVNRPGGGLRATLFLPLGA